MPVIVFAVAGWRFWRVQRRPVRADRDRRAGGVGLDDFRRVHRAGLFPPDVASDRDFADVNAWLKTLRRRG